MDDNSEQLVFRDKLLDIGADAPAVGSMSLLRRAGRAQHDEKDADLAATARKVIEETPSGLLLQAIVLSSKP